MVLNNIDKRVYETPDSELVEMDLQGIVCQSDVLEPIEEGGGHDW
jgi:hypothetical protein